MKKHLFSFLLIAALVMSCKSVAPDVEEDWLSGTSTSSQGNETQRNETIRANNTANNSTNNNANNSAARPSGFVGHEWKLIEVFVDGRNTGFSRSTLPEEPGNFLTLNFDAQNISGVGVPNFYSAPYTQGGNQPITIMLIRATLMASFFEPENITERDFFVYLQNVFSWRLVNDNLELLSKTQNGNDVRLVFSL